MREVYLSRYRSSDFPMKNKASRSHIQGSHEVYKVTEDRRKDRDSLGWKIVKGGDRLTSTILNEYKSDRISEIIARIGIEVAWWKGLLSNFLMDPLDSVIGDSHADHDAKRKSVRLDRPTIFNCIIFLAAYIYEAFFSFLVFFGFISETSCRSIPIEGKSGHDRFACKFRYVPRLLSQMMGLCKFSRSNRPRHKTNKLCHTDFFLLAVKIACDIVSAQYQWLLE